jgi:hypothetical protein
MDFPILVLSCEQEMDAMWKRLNKYFGTCKLYAASHFDSHLSDIPCFFDTAIVLSTSFEHGDYVGPQSSIARTATLLSLDHAPQIEMPEPDPDPTDQEIRFQGRSWSVQAACDRATELSMAGNRLDAISLWTAIRYRYPNHAEAAFQLGRLTLDHAREEADALYADARRLAPEHPAYAAATAADGQANKGQGSGLVVALREKLHRLTS